MPDLTDPLGLPYPTGSDLPCDAPATWCDFVRATEEQLLGLDTELNRVEPAIPACRLANRTPLVVSDINGVLVPWEGADFDTDGMFSPGQSIFRIFPRREGIYRAVGWVYVNPVTTPNGPFALQILNGLFGGGSVQGNVADDQIIVSGMGLRVMAEFAWGPTGVIEPNIFTSDFYGIGMVIQPISSGPVTITFATLAAYWVRDL